MFRKLPLSSLEELRDILNTCLRTSIFPDLWTESLVKFIPKPGGKGYRPISLASSVGKLMERLIQKRLDDFVEFNRLIPNHQFGYSYRLRLSPSSGCSQGIHFGTRYGRTRS